MTTRRRALRLLLGGGAALVFPGCNSSDQHNAAPAPLLGTFNSPCDVRLAEEIETIATFALVVGGWGFLDVTTSPTEALATLRLRLRDETIGITATVPYEHCDARCIFPELPRGVFPGIASANRSDTDSITEGVRVQFVTNNSACGGGRDTLGGQVFLIQPGNRDDFGLGPHLPFAIFSPHTQSLLTSDSSGRWPNRLLAVPAQSQCVLLDDFIDSIGTSIVQVQEWPQIGLSAFQDGDPITVRPINIFASCPQGNCTADGTHFNLCFGLPYLTRYFFSIF